MISLDVLRLGAITPLGFEAPATCAAFRAGVKALQAVYQPPFPSKPIFGGKIPSSVRLRRSHSEWLANLASCALAEAVDGFDAVGESALILNLPEVSPAHSEWSPAYAEKVLAAVQYRTKLKFRHVEMRSDGGSGVLSAILRAQELISSGSVRFCCIGGVDSLVNKHDIEMLRGRHCLRDEDHPMGVMPSEGAAFFLVAETGNANAGLARILGAGVNVDTQSSTRAPGLRAAFEAALRQSHTDESMIDFLVTDNAGERSVNLDHIIARMRTFRTRRPDFPHWNFAQSVGDTSAAAGAIGVVITAMAHHKGYGHGPYALCSASSASGSHAACVIGAANR